MTRDGTSAANRRRAARRDLSTEGEGPEEELSARAQALNARLLSHDSEPSADEVVVPAIAKSTARHTAVGGSAEFHPTTLAVDDLPPSPIHTRVVIAIVALLICATSWSYFGRLASYTTADGRIQAAGRSKVLEALATGQVVKIRVIDGDVVKSGDVLIELDKTDALAERTILSQNLTDKRAETLRLKVEATVARADPIDPTAKIPWDTDVPAIVRLREEGVARADLAKLASQITTLLSQKHAKEAERDKYIKTIESQKALVAITQENLTMIDSLMKSGYNSQAKYLDMKAQLDGQQVTETGFEGSLDHAKQDILVIDSQIASTRETFVTTATQAQSTNEQTIVDLAQQVVRADQNLSHMTLRAPVDGIVHATAVTTIGQVVKPGQQLLQIVPRDAPLEIQAYVSNTDIGFIRKGDAATIKLIAFTYNVYGSINGTVTDIANDSLMLSGKPAVQTSALDGDYRETSDAQKTASMQFPVTVRASRSTITVEGKEIPLVPGMGVHVEIITENRRAIDYLLSPLKELFSTAAHERS